MFTMFLVVLVLTVKLGQSVDFNILVATHLIAALAYMRWGYGSLTK